MHAGEFGCALTEELVAALATGKVHNVVSPKVLQAALVRAHQVQCKHAGRTSRQSDSQDEDPYAECLAFTAVSAAPAPFSPDSIGSLDFARLTYRVAWPLTVVLDAEVLGMYSVVSAFLVRLRRATWALNDAWLTIRVWRMHCTCMLCDVCKGDLKRCDRAQQAQFRQVEAYRHEMQHFLAVRR